MSTQNARQLSAGMVGGGIGADIGKTHRFGMRLDDRYSLDAGVFGRDREQSAGVAASLGVAPGRAYDTYQQMAEAEAAREDGIDVAIVATPNDSHFEGAKAFLERGINVVCEKPLTQDSATSRALVDLAAANDAILAVPHCYSAYPMVREAARMVSDGRLGRLTFIDVEHASGWAAAPLELTGHKQASWRTDPDVAGFPSVVGDLGTHGYHLSRYITGLEAERVSAQLHTFVPGRKVFDNATVALEYSDEVPGRLWASMAATGHNHGLRIRVFGDEGSLEWQHEDPHHLTYQDLEGTTTTYTHGLASLSEDSARLTRVGLGHPEGFLEAFGNFYRDLADELEARRDARPSTVRELSFPTGIDGLIGVQFVEAVAASHAADGAWIVPASVVDRDAEVAAADAELREAGGS
ncbi:Gfo/Idh/MocA family protein [Pseudoclavibacter helvolus]|uniref:Putative dehydrogenase n=1 Tax=Pseudoclavibacter helvolus TaxID=255205 RepID=A0A7W4URU2_9MICO|nr:Gfo/Idh/MocA family oxidoreductase [Pseudoclavibacter helvolus]MBB2959481.1 putative dehydrogenase [Pseudoclavibacter helvolus]